MSINNPCISVWALCDFERPNNKLQLIKTVYEAYFCE